MKLYHEGKSLIVTATFLKVTLLLSLIFQCCASLSLLSKPVQTIKRCNLFLF
jgi:hypothetical protein